MSVSLPGTPNLCALSTTNSSPAYSLKGRWPDAKPKPGPNYLFDMRGTYSGRQMKPARAVFGTAPRFPGPSKYISKMAECGDYWKAKLPTFMGSETHAVGWHAHDLEEQIKEKKASARVYPPVYDTRNFTSKCHNTYRSDFCPAFTERHHMFNEVPHSKKDTPGFDKYKVNHKAVEPQLLFGFTPTEPRTGLPPGVKMPKEGDPSTGPGKYPIPSTFHQAGDKLSDCTLRRSARYTLGSAPWRSKDKYNLKKNASDPAIIGASTTFGWRK
ncbi:unnamed protein product [Amoebophrya sp. A120]|nr:unnamed protein product [Amoebophrya sp. A120]|eukprot:GSA120T00018401001.1